MRSHLQEENSVAHHKVKCRGKPLARIYRKQEKKCWERDVKHHEVRRTEDQRYQERSPDIFSKPEIRSSRISKTPSSSCDSTNAAVTKQAPKKTSKADRPLGKKFKGNSIANSRISTEFEGAPGRAKLSCSLKKGQK
jgi:histone-lysine N-methyltransferase SETD8